MSFVPLHLKSQHSIGLGIAPIPELVQYAGRAGFQALALTDVEHLRGQVEFHCLCQAEGLRPISGVELRGGHEPGKALGQRSRRIVLLASDRRGYARLCQIVTQRRVAGGGSADPLSSIPADCEGLYVLTDDADVLTALVGLLGPHWVRTLLVRPGPSGSEPELRALSCKLGVRLVADLDATLLHPQDAELQALVGAVHLGSPMPQRRGAGEARLLLDRERVRQLFADVPQAVREAETIAEACRLDLLEAQRRPAQEALQRMLESGCREALRACPAKSTPRYQARLDAELAAIHTLGLAQLFAAVAALVLEARRRAIPLMARGSAVSSLVGHLLDFSPVDPLEHGLYFERFASEERRRPPDIDLDVASRGRDQLLEWLLEHETAERAARLCAVHGFGPRSALREGLKALGVASPEVEACLRRLPPPELGGSNDPLGGLHWPGATSSTRRLVARLVGKPRYLTLHPGGVVLAQREQLALIPLERSASGPLVAQYDAKSASALGLCKLDLLGNRCLDEIEDAVRLSAARASPCLGAQADVSAIPSEDAPTLRRIHAAQTIGCHQLESPAMRAVLASLPIRSSRDITHALAILRPGPASGSAKEAFLARARGEAPVAKLPAELSPRLSETLGMLLYEEDILFVLSTLGGLPLATAEALRVRLVERADDTAWLERAGCRFRKRALERGFESRFAEAMWIDVLRFGRYSFSRAHAASQALLAYRAAFLQCHAALEFGCASLNHHGGAYPRRVIASELARRGIELRLPSVLRALAGCELEAAPQEREGTAIRIGLGLVKGVRAETRQRLLAWQKSRVGRPSCDALLAQLPLLPKELEALTWSGALDEIAGLGRGDYPWVHEALLRKWLRGSRSDSRRTIDEARQRLPAGPPQLVARYAGLSRVQGELRYLGMHISDHPMRLLRPEADRHSCVASDRLGQYVDRVISFAGVLAAARNVPVAERGAVQFSTLEDEHGLVEARLSPEQWARFHQRLSTPGPYLLRAAVRRRQGATYLAILDVLPFHERKRSQEVSIRST